MSLERAERHSNLHKTIYLLPLLILKLKNYPLTLNHICFPEVRHIISFILTGKQLLFTLSCEGKGKVLVTLQGDTEEELTFDTLNIPVLDAQSQVVLISCKLSITDSIFKYIVYSIFALDSIFKL